MRSEEGSISGRNSDGEALRSIINKLSDERNLRDLHLKHHLLKFLRPLPACGKDMSILHFDEAET